ncbi:hypothetical protein BT96DRAFT_1015663 [Gymnopus androsaceus JB14]|uniref:Uncharacterized protein n=1 Tax=Gymnopus androsaceus JB14 TaxID=1447944 RepID=A0A6A4I9S5_9AGAR|nr:hypothetical protein BT96DRAFT_1015663 [Gymnopus androsaceus JB14]
MANVQAGPAHSSAQNHNDPQNPLSWEGDRMFNIYIYDYCFKRGFRRTARELLAEAEIPPESQPPINARQGLLFEWWSVFWVLFTAKASGNGSEDALIYTQHQANQANNRARALPLTAIGQPGPSSRLPMHNRPFPPNGPMPNGVGPNPGFPSGSHLNGSAPPMPGQPRQTMPGNPRGSAGNGPPFSSPTMSHSPAGPHPSQQQQPLHQSPHPGPRMPPPPPNNGMQGIPHGYMTRPPSRTASPGQMGSMMHRSPSMDISVPMSARQPQPSMQQDHVTNELMRLQPSILTALKEELGLSGKELPSMNMDEKKRVHGLWQRKSRTPGPANAAAGPSTMPQRRGAGKRNSTSPREDLDVPGTGSPPTKKPRRSPVENHAYPHPPQPGMTQPSNGMGPPGGPVGPGPGPGPGQPPIVMRPMNASMNGFQGGMGQMNMAGPPPMGANVPPHSMNSMSPPMPGMPGQSGMMTTPQMQPMNLPRQPDGPAHYRNSLTTFHRGQLHTGGVASPSDPSFGGAPGGPNPTPQFPGGPGGGNNRMSKPGAGIMPPPSPGMKDLSKDNNNMMKGMTPQSASGGNSSTPGPPGGQGQGQGPLGLNHQPGPPSQNPTPNSNPNPNPPPPSMDPSPSMLAGNPAPHMGMMTNGMTPDLPLFSADFMNDIGGALDTFDPSIFRDSGDLNFERDFGQWFNPNDQALDDSLDPMK